jgi:phosphatidylserine/phosphatidylglycerophosphate/cardiolipin synthase-like enzyme
MLEWIVSLLLLGALVAYIVMDYHSRRYERDALRALRVENQHLQRYVDEHVSKQKADTTFTATLEKVGIDSIEDSLHGMISRAQSEILIVTPWIKEAAWQRIKGRVSKFCKDGGALKVYIRGIDEDFSASRSDRSVVDEIRRFGGVVTCVPDLHAKLYVIDRHEALITSANLTRSGLDFGYEAGVWTCNPALVQEACRFVETLAG